MFSVADFGIAQCHGKTHSRVIAWAVEQLLELLLLRGREFFTRGKITSGLAYNCARHKKQNNQRTSHKYSTNWVAKDHQCITKFASRNNEFIAESAGSPASRRNP
jgi:hypothetical protein